MDQPALRVDWLSRLHMTCVGCGEAEGADTRPPSGNVNAAWALQGRWRRHTSLGDLSTGFVGVRNSVLPLSAVIRPDGQLDQAALGAPGTSAFAPGSQWAVTAGVEKTLMTRETGATVGVGADVVVPVENAALGPGDPRASDRGKPAIRVGLVVRW